MLDRRLSRILGEIIGESQHAFVEGQQILDAIMAANEVFDDLVADKKEGLICKLDMEKAYDHVNWSFVDDMLGRFGFGPKWRLRMHRCIKTTPFAFLINGGPSNFFKASRGVRQGDPLSSMLFILIMRALDGLMNMAKELQLFKGVGVGRDNLTFEVSHLLFADNTLIFCHLDVRNSFI